MERGQRHIHRQFFTRILDIRRRIHPARGDINVWRCRVSREMEWICQAAPREYRFPCFRLFLPGCLLVAVASRRASSSLACAKIDRPDNTSPGEGSKNEFDDREKETTVTRSRVEATGPTTRRMNRGTTIGKIERTIGRSKEGCVRRKWRRAVPISPEPWWT